MTLYLRAKVGFCNCTTGIAEDEEIDRVGDLSLVGWQSRRARARRAGRGRLDEGAQPARSWSKGATGANAMR